MQRRLVSLCVLTVTRSLHRRAGHSPKILVTGGSGQIGNNLVRALTERHGKSNVLSGDVRRPASESGTAEQFVFCDITNRHNLEQIVSFHGIKWIINQSAILSYASEMNPEKWRAINIDGFINILEVARSQGVERVFSASTIASFGSSTPKVPTDVTIQRPTSLYGISKVFNELLGEYYFKHYGIDFRCLRYPAIVGVEGEARGRTADYMMEIFIAALAKKKFVCDVPEQMKVPYMYLDDAVRATMQLVEAPRSQLTQCVYNIHAISASASDVAAEIKKLVKDFTIEYKVNPVREAIYATWPTALNDSQARKDWGWKEEFDLKRLVSEALSRIRFARVGEALQKPGKA